MAIELKDLRRLLDPLVRHIRLIVSRGVMTALADDSSPRQRLALALLAGEERSDVERLQQYGVTSNPPEGSEVICVACGGVRDSTMAVAVDHSASRPRDLHPTEVALWMKEHGIRVLLAKDGHIDLGTNPTEHVALAPPVKNEFQGVKGDFDAVKNYLASLKLPVDMVTLTAGPPADPLVLSYSPGEVAAEEVRAK